VATQTVELDRERELAFPSDGVWPSDRRVDL